jgi:hypothetical protein
MDLGRTILRGAVGPLMIGHGTGDRGGCRGILAGDRAVQRARGARVRARAAVPARGGSGRSRLSAAGTGSHAPGTADAETLIAALRLDLIDAADFAR